MCRDSLYVHPLIDQLTFISGPRANVNREIYNRNKLAISSWLSVSLYSHVLLFINRSEFGALADELDHLYGSGRVIYGGHIKTNLVHVPYIDEWFRQGIQRSPSNHVCFINADILLSANWFMRVKQIFHLMADHPILAIGQRMNSNLNAIDFQNLSFGHRLLQNIDDMVRKSRHSPETAVAMDTFLFRIDHLPLEPKSVPPFIMGRYYWDNWLVGYLNHHCDGISFSLNTPIYHINHQPNRRDSNDDQFATNKYLWEANKRYFGSNLDVTWRLLGDILVHRRSSIQIRLD
jgi:hypothetical protein